MKNKISLSPTCWMEWNYEMGKRIKAGEVRDWLTVVALVVSLGGLVFNAVLKPERSNLDLGYRIKAVEQRLDDLQGNLNSRLLGIEKNVDRIWQRLK